VTNTLLKKTQKGFTVAELLISIFILSVGIMGMIQAFPLGTKVWKSSQRSTIASQLGQEKIEEILAQSYSEISTGIIETKHQLDSPFVAYQRETTITCVDPAFGFSEVVGCSPDPGMKKIEVVVFWKAPFGLLEKNAKITGLIAKK